MQLNLKHLGNNYVLPKNCQPGTNWIALNYTEKPIVCELGGVIHILQSEIKEVPVLSLIQSPFKVHFCFPK